MSSSSSSPRCLAKAERKHARTYRPHRTSIYDHFVERRRPLRLVAVVGRGSREASVKIRSDNPVCVTIRTIKFVLGVFSPLTRQTRICRRMPTSIRGRINFQPSQHRRERALARMAALGF